MQIFMGNQIELNEELNIKKSRWSFLKYHPSNQLTLSIINCFTMLLHTEAVIRGCSIKKMFLEISQILQENSCARVCYLIRLQVLAYNFIK